MWAQRFDIVERLKERSNTRADIENFRLQPTGLLPAERLLTDPAITLYSLDLNGRQGVFVEVPGEVDLSRVPFYYITQYEQAINVLTLPFEEMIRLAAAVTLDDERLVCIHSTGRAGSTLASQIFAQVDGAVNLSEPDALTWLVAARNHSVASEADLRALADATVRLLCKTPAQSVWVLKGRSFWIELGDWLADLYPGARNIFLYRDGESWLNSGMHAYVDHSLQTEEAADALAAEWRTWLEPVTPLVARYDGDRPLTPAGLLALMWLSVMERYEALAEAGISMLPIRFESWQTAPRATAEAMLRYAGVNPATVPTLDETLGRDAQAGSHLARAVVSRHETEMRPEDLAELAYHLNRHPTIHAADFVIPGTL